MDNNFTKKELRVTVLFEGKTFNNVTLGDLKAKLGGKAGAAWAAAISQYEKANTRAAIRQEISKNVGDTDTILGTTADVTQLNAGAVLAFISAIGAGDTYPKFRKAFMDVIESLVPETDGDDVYAQAGAFLAAVQSGDIILTAALKGLPAVINEMATRSTGVAQVLMAAAQEDAD